MHYSPNDLVFKNFIATKDSHITEEKENYNQTFTKRQKIRNRTF